MKNFIIGLGTGLAGVATWAVCSVLEGLARAAGSDIPSWLLVFKAIGFAVMLLGPDYFWIFLPLRRRFPRRSPGRT